MECHEFVSLIDRRCRNEHEQMIRESLFQPVAIRVKTIKSGRYPDCKSPNAAQASHPFPPNQLSDCTQFTDIFARHDDDGYGLATKIMPSKLPMK
jgi:hypothetical protein